MEIRSVIVPCYIVGNFRQTLGGLLVVICLNTKMNTFPTDNLAVLIKMIFTG